MVLTMSALFVGCNKNDNPISKNAKEGGLIEVNTQTVVYFINSMDSNYLVNLKYYQGKGADISKIEVYKQFFTVNDAGNPISSDRTLYKTIDLSSETQPGYLDYTASFSTLIAGTTINGVAVPDQDTSLKPGFYWELTYDIILDDGRTVHVPSKTLFINSRLAGRYNVTWAEYYRLGVLTYDLTDWPASVDITALNANTFKMLAPCEPFGSNEIYFTVDDASGAISVLKSFGGNALTVNNIAVANCVADPGAFTHVPCDNIYIKVPTTKDTIKITFGYVTPTGSAVGPREFTQVMVKQ